MRGGVSAPSFLGAALFLSPFPFLLHPFRHQSKAPAAPLRTFGFGGGESRPVSRKYVGRKGDRKRGMGGPITTQDLGFFLDIF